MLLVKLHSSITVQELKSSFTAPRTLRAGEEYQIVKEEFDRADGKRYFISENEFIRYRDQNFEGEKFEIFHELRVIQYWEICKPKDKEPVRFEFHYNPNSLLEHFSAEEIPTLEFKLRAETK